MTSMQIKESETGLTRVFHLDLPPEAVERFTTQAGTGEWPLQYGLGATKLRPAFVEVVAIRDLADMPLSTYLSEAYGAMGADFKADRARLDALKGHVVVLPSQAFDATAQTLTVAAPLRWIGTYTDTPRAAGTPPLRSSSSKGTLSGGKPDGSMSRGGSTLLKLLVVALAVVFITVILLALGNRG